MDWTIMTRLAIALAIGLIIGLERGWQNEQDKAVANASGLRSFGIMSLLGGLAGLLGAEFGAGLVGVMFLGAAAVVAGSYWLTVQQTKDLGTTTELALLLTFALGALALTGLAAEAVATAVVASALLTFKQELHQSLSKLNRQELLATLQLLLIAAVALPLLPNEGIGPWEAVNPRTIGLLVMLIAAIAYAGYFAVRFFGENLGLLATAVLGGLVSSTAVTVAFSQKAKQSQGSLSILGAGIALASGTMAVRLLVEVAVVNSSLVQRLIPPVACLALVPLAAALVVSRRKGDSSGANAIPLNNPIDLKSALTYGLVLTVLFVAVRATEAWLGDKGIYLLSAVSGIADVDAVSLSLAEAAKQGLSESVAYLGILIAVAVNTLVKASLVLVIGGKQLARWCASILLVALGMSCVVALLA
jgi:uncharacterized membrane protein (DUF4010 family)